MKLETQKRIRAYQNALPHMKERVMAVALLLVISISMVTSASFAWVTLSKAPEVTGLATTIATNGNLEIALSDIDGLAPDESKVGDGGKDVMLSNLTWGNLVNLSDPRYGLEAITLRPAVLNSGTLNTAPLYSVKYGTDGRIVDTVSDFMFTNYGTKDGISAFYVPEDGTTDYGVRAVSSVTVSTAGEEQLVDQMNKAMNRSYLGARTSFQNLYGNKSYMNAVTQLAGVYLNYRLNDSDQSCGIYIEDLYYMTEEFHNTMEKVKENILDVANLQHYVYCNQNNKTYVAFTEADMLDGSMKTKLASEDITISALDLYISMRSHFYGDGTSGAYFKIKNIYTEYKRTGRFVGWEELAGVGSVGGPINVLADIPSATVNGVRASSISKDNLGDVTGHDPNICVVHTGLIKDMDQLLGTQLHARVDSISVIIVTVKNVEVSTAAQSPWILAEDNNAASEAAAGDLVARNATAADTYGMAIDFWVRTNSKNSRLILEGEYVKEVVVLTDAAGNPLLDDDGKEIKEERIVGYQGVNRVWEDDDQNLPNHLGMGTSATQGAGSCYVFYLDNPEDQDQSLEMLKAMTVAFVDKNGNLLVEAALDTENVFKDGGRILVPLQARGRTVVTGQTPKLDDNGDPVMENGEVVMENVEEVVHYITDLNANEPMRITAIMYMDGSKLTNDQVLASGSIKGQLNIQFGTTEDLVSVNDTDLKKEYYNISVDVTRVSGDFDKYDPTNKPVVDVTLTLEGMDASVVKGNFISMLSTSQGAKQDPFVLVHQPNTATWTARVTLNGAGTYQLRSIQIDGVDYPLTATNIQEEQIVIPGTTVNNVNCIGWNGNSKYNYMSADAFYDLEMTVDISGTRPRTVQAVFENANRQNVTVTFGPDGESRWRGTGIFTTSGDYDLTYMIIDGVRVPLLGTDYKHLSLKLGMKTRVFITQPVNAEYKALNEIKEALSASSVSLTEQQKTLLNQVIADSDLPDADKTALTAGVNGTLTSTQCTTLKTVLTAKMEAVLDDLYNGDPNDTEDGLQMTSTAAGYTFFYIGGAGNELYMDVSCIITDDKGNPLTGLSGVKLEYQLGASAILLDSNLTWNSASGYYEGQFQLINPGNYTFKQLQVGENLIKSASSAPKITANSRDPMEYVGPSIENVAVYQNINPNASREMTVVLKYAPSATVKMILEYTDTDANGNALLETHELMADLSYSDNDRNLYEYTVNVPKDGNWKIVGMKVANVVYVNQRGDKVYFDGVDTADGGTGWVDLTQAVLEDNIETQFFTTVIYSVNTQPNTAGYSGEFMTDHKVENMKVTLTDYLGRPVDGANVTLEYNWNSGSAANYFTVNSGTTYPNSSFKATKQADGITFAMPATMNFQLPGQYNITFDMKIGEEAYNFSDFTKAQNSVELKTSLPVEVSWTLPDVKITGVTNATKDSLNNRTFNVDLNSDGTGVSYAPLQVQNYFEDYYAVAYISTAEKGTHTAPEVTLQMAGIGNATSAKIALSATDWSCQYTFTPTGTAELPQSTQNFGGVSTSLLDFVKDRYRAGTQKITAVTMTYGGIDYAVKTAKTVELHQPQAPSYYLILNYDASVMKNGVDVIGISSKGKQFTASGTNGSVTISSPDNRTFKVVLPKTTMIVPDRIYDDPNMSVSYDTEAGTAKSSYVYLRYTQDERDGCETVTKTYYKQYQRYERVATKIGTRKHYEDTYIIYKWGDYDSDTELSVTTKAVTLTAATPTLTSKLLKTEQLQDNITEYIYKAVSGKDKLSAKENAADPVYDLEEDIVQTWTEVK